VDSIEHGGLVDDETALLMKEEGVRLVPTLYRLDWTVENARAGGAEAAVVERLSAARDAAMARARRAFELGVPVVLGTDATVVPHGLNAREAAVYAKLGMKPAGVLRAATLDAAALLGLEGRLGALEPGLFADVIAVEGNPLDDVGALEHVRFVMKEGVVHRDDREHAPSGKAGAPGAPRTPE
jgi:imidazolonepropionase-like amidohydrolase